MTMTTLKRTIVILFLLMIAFFIYRWISPTWAEYLITRIKTISTMFLGSGNMFWGEETWLSTGQHLPLISGNLASSGIEKTWFVSTLSGMISWTSSTGISPISFTWSSSIISIKKTSISSTSSQGLSSKDIHDTETLLKNLFQ
jgi:hypothetical protein